jgi:hypothetical protein
LKQRRRELRAGNDFKPGNDLENNVKGAFAMVWQGVLAKAAPTVVTGVVGMVAYEGLRKVVAKKPLRAVTVAVTAWGLRAAREAEEGAARARLAVADVVAEAAERIGNETPPPAAHSGDDPAETIDAVR